MSSRAHRPADEGLADFAASEGPAYSSAGPSTRAAAGIPSDGGERRLGTAPADDVISSEREAPDVSAGAAPALESSSDESPGGVAPPGAELSDTEAKAGRAPPDSGEAPTDRDGSLQLEAAPAPEPEHGAAAARTDAVLGQLEAMLDQPEASAQRDAGDESSASADLPPAPAGSSASSEDDAEELADESESIEVESRDFEPADPAPAADEASGAYAGNPAPDVSEMTADELALATQSEGSDPPAWEGEATFPELEPGAGAAEGVSERGARFDAPWVDEVPDPVTPYEQRVSETVRVADLPPAEQLRGRVLANRYIAEEIAEQTPSSITYRAYHLALDRSVCVKILPRGLACPEETCQEVRRLAAVATALAHPNVAATLDFGVLPDGWPYLVTEQLTGLSLAQLLRQEGKFVLRRVLHIGKQLAAGLGAAHQAGLVHGLVNPDNVVVIEPGTSAEIASVVGFGVSIARGAVPGPPRSGVFGVPFYVSPEQAGCRPLDARSDIYSLGVVLYEMMTGRPPFTDGDFAGVLCQHLDDEAPPPSSRLRSPGALAKAMDAIIQRCLRKEPVRRYQTAAELADDLIRLEAAAARNKRRPMSEVKRPTTTIHSPPPKAAEGAVGPEAKVIVHDDADGEVDAETPASQGKAAGVRGRPGASTPVSGTGFAAVQDRGPVSVSKPPVTRAPRISVDQATIKISAVDRALIQRPGSPVRPAAASPAGAEQGGGLMRRIGGALKRLFGSSDVEKR